MPYDDLFMGYMHMHSFYLFLFIYFSNFVKKKRQGVKTVMKKARSSFSSSTGAWGIRSYATPQKKENQVVFPGNKTLAHRRRLPPPPRAIDQSFRFPHPDLDPRPHLHARALRSQPGSSLNWFRQGRWRSSLLAADVRKCSSLLTRSSLLSNHRPFGSCCDAGPSSGPTRGGGGW